MGFGGMSSTFYSAGVKALHDTGEAFKRSATAAATHDYSKIADILNPRKLKKGMRECCYAAGFTDVLPVIVAIDGTGSMHQVPHDIQNELAKFIDLLVQQGVSDHPNVLFMCFDDETVIKPDAAFQMSEFESGTKELTTSLNEMVIPGQGGGNDGEAYHLPFYAAANHTRLECFEREGKKGIFFIVEDEQPCYDDGDPKVHGTSPAIAKELFDDTIQEEIPLVESVRKTNERYHIFVIRPGHTSHGKDKSITKKWQDLMRDAGANPQHVLEVDETKDIIPTMALAIGRLSGADADELVDVLKAKGVDADGAARATKAIVPFAGAELATAGKASGALITADGEAVGRTR